MVLFMASKSSININVDTQVKEEATAILKGLGLDMNTFINMALIQVVKRKGLPFEVVNDTPSKDMLEALTEVNEMISNPEKYPRFSNREDLKKALIN